MSVILPSKLDEQATISAASSGVTVVIADNVPGTVSDYPPRQYPPVYTLTFSEAVTGLEIDDFIVGNGNVFSLEGSGAVWTAIVVPLHDFQGDMTLTLKANAVTNAAGLGNLEVTAEPQPVDLVKPELIGRTPERGSTTFGVMDNIELRFSEEMMRGSGVVLLSRGNGGGLVERFDIATSERIAISGSTVIIDPTEELDHNVEYILYAAPDAFVDLARNPVVDNFLTTVFKTEPVGASILQASNGLVFSVGGEVTIVGTPGVQDVTVLSHTGVVTFDPSFNRGNDAIRLWDDGYDWYIMREGSVARMFHPDGSEIQIPLGIAGQPIVFEDGARELVFKQSNQTPYIGDMSFAWSSQVITALPDGTSIPTGEIAAARGTFVLAEDADIEFGGNLDVYGTQRGETVHVIDGDVTFDPSFNRGGDVISLDWVASLFIAWLEGSNVLLALGGIHLSIPVGRAGVTLDFAGDERELYYDTAMQHVMLGTQVITDTAGFLFA